MASVQHTFRARTRGQDGYILLTLLLFVALLSITAAAVIPSITFQIRRDREEELIHRGVQYSRAIRKYYKKFGRYPTSLKDLDNTNNMRFLREHYKDPITGKDFKLLHFGEVQLGTGGGIAGATSAAALAAAGNAGAASTGGKAFSLGPASQTSAAQEQPGKQNTGEGSGSGAATTGPTSAGQGGLAGGSGQVFGGGPIIGVVSTSKAQSIREFNHKDHYNEWQFIYDPTTDRGGLLNTPNQPPLVGVVPNAQTNPTNAPGGFNAPPGGLGPGAGSMGPSPMGPGMGSFGSQPPPNQPQQNQPQH